MQMLLSRHLSLLRFTGVLAAALVAGACSTPVANRPATLDRVEGGGFSLHQEIQVSGGVRADFDEAVRLLAREQYASAAELLKGVTREAPEATAAHIDLGIAYARTGDLERAKQSLERAVELAPRHPVAHNELGIVHRRTGRFAEARRSYEAALAIHPEFHFARKNLAILCDLYLADPICALEHYELYGQANPADEKVAIWIVDLQNRMER